MAKNKVKTTRCPECNSTSTYMRVVRSPGIVCRNCGKFFPKEKKKAEKTIPFSPGKSSSPGKCPSCGGLVKNGKCETCHAKKFQEMFIFKEKEEKKIEDRADQADQQVDQADRADQESYVCECGEKVLVKESIDTSWWDGIEWVICPECGERKKR